MSTTPCSGCGQDVEEGEVICPHCGRGSLTSGEEWVLCSIGGFFLLLLVYGVVFALWQVSPILVLGLGVAVAGLIRWFSSGSKEHKKG